MSIENNTISVNNKETIWNKAFTSIFIVNITMNMAQFMMNTLIPKFADFLGANAAVVGIVTGMFAITALSTRPIVGSAIGYFRKNRLLAMAIGFIAFAFVCYGFSNNITMIMIGRLIHGLGMGFTAPICLALASDALPETKMASGIGIFTLGQAVSTAVGPSIGLKLADIFGYNTTFFICAIIMSASLILALRLKITDPDRKERFKISYKSIVAPEVIIPAIIMLLLSGAYSCLNSFIVIYAGLSKVSSIGLFFTVYAISVLFTRPFSGRIADKYGLDKILIPSMLMFALSFLIISLSHSLTMFLISAVISAFGFGICQPAVQTLTMRLVSKERRGIAGNTQYIGVDTGFLITPALAGAIVTFVQNDTGNKILGYEVMYRVMIIPILFALGIFLLKRKELMQKLK